MQLSNEPPAGKDDASAATGHAVGARRFRPGAVLEWLVGLAIIIGGVMAVRSGSERSQLRAEHRRLIGTVGELPIADPEKVWFVALETGDPLHFAWRVYLPANYHFRIRHDNGSSSSWRSDPAEFVARIRFRVSDTGTLQVYGDYGSGSSLASRGDGKVSHFVQQHWDRLEVEQLGSKDAVSVDPADSATLLRIRMPEDLQSEAAAVFPPYLQSEFIPTFYSVTLGPVGSPP